ncbi:MAG: GDPmannose 4,6-dehydratase, partial [Planctomycetota bacterium]
ELVLGNLDARRDWGHARDYVRAQWMMLQQDEPDDYVIATGKAHTVGDCCRVAFEHLDLDFEKYVRTDPKWVRPAEVDLLIGDASKAKRKLGWEPEITFEKLIQGMVDSDLQQLGS